MPHDPTRFYWAAFLQGAASILDLFGTLNRPVPGVDYARDQAEADRMDREALASDWEAVRDDLQAAVGQYKSRSATHED